MPKYFLVGIVTSVVIACGGGNETLPIAQTPHAPVQASMSSPVAVTPTEPAGKTPPPAPIVAHERSTVSPAPQLNDEQIAAVTDAAHTGQIDQARLAERRARTGRVKQFAAMMIAHHMQAKQQQAELLKKLNVTEVESPQSAAVRDESRKVLELLEATTDFAFDRAYIDVQVNEDQDVLDSIDTVLIPNAKNADLRAALEDIRPKVAAHLQEALDIQRSLAAAG